MSQDNPMNNYESSSFALEPMISDHRVSCSHQTTKESPHLPSLCCGREELVLMGGHGWST